MIIRITSRVDVSIHAVSPLSRAGAASAAAGASAAGAASASVAAGAASAGAVTAVAWDAAVSWACDTPSRPNAARPSAIDAMSFLMECLLESGWKSQDGGRWAGDAPARVRKGRLLSECVLAGLAGADADHLFKRGHEN